MNKEDVRQSALAMMVQAAVPAVREVDPWFAGCIEAGEWSMPVWVEHEEYGKVLSVKIRLAEEAVVRKMDAEHGAAMERLLEVLVLHNHGATVNVLVFAVPKKTEGRAGDPPEAGAGSLVLDDKALGELKAILEDGRVFEVGP